MNNKLVAASMLAGVAGLGNIFNISKPMPPEVKSDIVLKLEERTAVAQANMHTERIRKAQEKRDRKKNAGRIG